MASLYSGFAPFRHLHLKQQKNHQRQTVPVCTEWSPFKTKKMTKHEPLIWTSENGPLNDFLECAKGFGHEYVIYVQDALGDNRSVWSCKREDLLECYETFSARCYFGRIQPIRLAITFGFYDQDVTDVHGYQDIEPE
jgi:hypothetical protein